MLKYTIDCSAGQYLFVGTIKRINYVIAKSLVRLEHMITWNVIRDLDAPKLITMSCSDRDTSLKRYVDMKLI